MNSKWVSFSPHIFSRSSTTRTYITMLILLCPVLACAIIMHGLNSLFLVVASVVACYLTDVLFKLVVEKNFDFSDVSSIFIGFIIGLLLPTGANWYVSIIGSCFSIIFIRNIAGGIGKNFVSEIAVAVLISQLVFRADFWMFYSGGEIVSTCALDSVIAGERNTLNFESLLFGGYAGTIAETSVIWLLIAGIILMVFGIVDCRIPIVILASVFLFAYLFFDLVTAVNLIGTGGVILVAFFVATDYAVVPKSGIGKFIYAFFIGFLTVLIWKFGNYQMAIYYAVIIMGLGSSIFNGLTKTIRINTVGR